MSLEWLRSRATIFRESGGGLAFLRLFLPVAGAFLCLWVASLYLEAVLENRQRRVLVQDATHQASRLLADTIRDHVADLAILVRLPSLGRLIAGASAETAGMDFAVFVAEKPEIQQLRYLDSAGNEVLRFDRTATGIVEVAGADLQNKADRYYFRRAISLPAGALYLSPIDLNVEHGTVETPWRPTLRIAMPVARGRAAAAGMVVLNLAVDRMIGQIDRARPNDSEPLQLLNGNGYWLGGVPAEQLWGFMFDRETTLAATAPDLWRQLRTGQSGSLEADGAFYAFAPLHPDRDMALPETIPQIRSDDPVWIVLGRVADVGLGDLHPLQRLPVALVSLPIIALICLGWSHATTAQRRAEDEFVRMERMASLGGLVAGVAHELNTPIGNAVTMASALADRAVTFGKAVEEGQLRRAVLDKHLTDMREGTALMLRGLERAAELVQHFKQVAVDQSSEQRRRFRIADLVNELADTVRPQFKHGNLTLETDIEAQTELDSYPGALDQVLLNLLGNAELHGFDPGQPGTITIAARELPGNRVEISVRDDGKGMTEALQAKIFRPFFTTRRGNGGSGLGLSIVFNIVKNLLGGTIRVESAPGTGTGIVVELPAQAPGAPESYAEGMYDVRG